MPWDRLLMAKDEIVDLTDQNDRVTGKAALAKCLGEGLLHRAVAVLVERGDGRFVLQQRSKRDEWHPGLWAISSTGHVRSGEGYREAARRELEEELGIVAEVREFRKYLLPPISSGGITELEWVTLFTCVTDSQCKIDYSEVEGVNELLESELRKLIETGPLTPDTKIILADFFYRREKH